MERIKATAHFQLKSSGRTQKVQKEVEVDQHTIHLATFTAGRAQLEAWARQYFPDVEKVTVESIVPHWR
jgi:hypothetical protein